MACWWCSIIHSVMKDKPRFVGELYWRLKWYGDVGSFQGQHVTPVDFTVLVTYIHIKINQYVKYVRNSFLIAKKQPLSCSLQKSNTVMFGSYVNRHQKLAEVLQMAFKAILLVSNQNCTVPFWTDSKELTGTVKFCKGYTSWHTVLLDTGSLYCF